MPGVGPKMMSQTAGMMLFAITDITQGRGLGQAGIDPIAVEDIQKIVAKLVFKNIGVLITDHNVQETLSITDRAYLLFDGKIIKSGTAEELSADEQVRKVYLGEHFELKKKKIT